MELRHPRANPGRRAGSTNAKTKPMKTLHDIASATLEKMSARTIKYLACEQLASELRRTLRETRGDVHDRLNALGRHVVNLTGNIDDAAAILGFTPELPTKRSRNVCDIQELAEVYADRYNHS